jgi:hypothetical protein
MARKETQEKEAAGGELTDIPSDKYRKFFDKFAETKTLDPTEWKPAHLVGFFAQRFQDVYGASYKFKFNSPSPSKCFEIFQIKKLAYLLTDQPKILRDYIEWVFLEKAIKSKRRFTSISFLTREEIIKEFKFEVLLAGKKNLEVNRATSLPSDYREILERTGLGFIKTYGDLSFAVQMSPPPPSLSEAIVAMKELGFDVSLLGRIT